MCYELLGAFIHDCYGILFASKSFWFCMVSDCFQDSMSCQHRSAITCSDLLSLMQLFSTVRTDSSRYCWCGPCGQSCLHSSQLIVKSSLVLENAPFYSRTCSCHLHFRTHNSNLATSVSHCSIRLFLFSFEVASTSVSVAGE